MPGDRCRCGWNNPPYNGQWEIAKVCFDLLPILSCEVISFAIPGGGSHKHAGSRSARSLTRPKLVGALVSASQPRQHSFALQISQFNVLLQQPKPSKVLTPQLQHIGMEMSLTTYILLVAKHNIKALSHSIFSLCISLSEVRNDYKLLVFTSFCICFTLCTFILMYLGAYAHMCVHVCICVGVHIEASTQLSLSLCLTSPTLFCLSFFVYLYRAFYWAETHHVLQTGWPVNYRDPPAPAHPTLGFSEYATMPGFIVWVLEVKHGSLYWESKHFTR